MSVPISNQAISVRCLFAFFAVKMRKLRFNAS
jgi:hypothetical protein